MTAVRHIALVPLMNAGFASELLPDHFDFSCGARLTRGRPDQVWQCRPRVAERDDISRSEITHWEIAGGWLWITSDEAPGEVTEENNVYALCHRLARKLEALCWFVDLCGGGENEHWRGGNNLHNCGVYVASSDTPMPLTHRIRYVYATREWCQREMLIAKRHGMPIVILDCLDVGEERGSFLMDHVPRIPVRTMGAGWNKYDVRRGLNLLVDECLKRVIWGIQKEIASDRRDLAISWWAPYAPEPVTLAQWIEDGLSARSFRVGDDDLRVLHPDPPLGPEESAALQQILALTGHTGRLDVLTPRMLAARGA